MLVLSRKPGECVVMPQSGVVVTVFSVHGNRVRLGIAAPSDVAVYREEIGPVPGDASPTGPAIKEGA